VHTPVNTRRSMHLFLARRIFASYFDLHAVRGKERRWTQEEVCGGGVVLIKNSVARREVKALRADDSRCKFGRIQMDDFSVVDVERVGRRRFLWRLHAHRLFAFAMCLLNAFVWTNKEKCLSHAVRSASGYLDAMALRKRLKLPCNNHSAIFTIPISNF
jgi:hypothetical protein